MNNASLTKSMLRNLSLSTYDLNLSVRSQNGLINGDIAFVWQLVQYRDWDLLKIKNFGRKSLNEINGKLQSLGFHLATVLDSEQLEAIASYEHVPDNAYLAEWLKTIVQQISQSPLDLLTEQQEKVLRGRTWVVGKKPAYSQLARSLDLCGQTVRMHEKKALFKMRQYFSQILVDVNYSLLSEFAARGNCIHLADTVFELRNLPHQQQVIAESLLGLAVQGLVVDWEQSVLTLHEYTEYDMRILKDYFSQSEGTVRGRFITRELLGIQQSNEGIIRYLDSIHKIMWLEA